MQMSDLDNLRHLVNSFFKSSNDSIFGAAASQQVRLFEQKSTGPGKSELIMKQAIKKLADYAIQIRSGEFNHEKVSDLYSEASNYYENVNDDLLKAFNAFEIGDFDRYQSVQQQFILASKDLNDAFFTFELEQSVPGKTRGKFGSNEIVDKLKPNDFKEKAKNEIEKISAHYGDDYFPTSHTDSEKNVGVFIYSSENGISYGFSTAYIAWEDKVGKVQVKELVNTRETKDYLHFNGLKETDDSFEVDIVTGGSFGGEAWKKALKVDKKFMNLPGDNYSELSLEEKLKLEGFFEEHAKFIASDLQNTLEMEIEEGTPVTVASKNKVYYLSDVFGNKKTIKFYKSEKEANMQSLVNYFFSTDKDLAKLVPGSNLQKPLSFEVDGKLNYVVVEDDVREKATYDEGKLNFRLKKVKKEFLSSWMHKLATIHVKGTAIMNLLGNYEFAQKTVTDRDKERVETWYDIGTLHSIEDACDTMLEGMYSFINQDLLPANSIGQYIVDWGNAGRGNVYVDISNILNHPKIYLSEDEKKYYVEKYLFARSKLEKGTPNEKMYESDKEFLNYQRAEFVVLNRNKNHFKMKTIHEPTPEIVDLNKSYSEKLNFYQES